MRSSGSGFERYPAVFPDFRIFNFGGVGVTWDAASKMFRVRHAASWYRDTASHIRHVLVIGDKRT
jgi:hypothetical protein